MAQVTGRPTPAGANTLFGSIRRLDTTPHPLHNLRPRTVQPYNYSPLGPATRHVAAPLKPAKLK